VAAKPIGLLLEILMDFRLKASKEAQNWYVQYALVMDGGDKEEGKEGGDELGDGKHAHKEAKRLVVVRREPPKLEVAEPPH
jgi:hypothetical protein